MTDPGYRARDEARLAIYRLAKEAGAAMAIQGSRETPESLAGIRATTALSHAVTLETAAFARRAREEGRTWQAIGEALGCKPGTDTFVSAADTAFLRLASDLGGGRLSFMWRCPVCGSLIGDRGPWSGHPADAEVGHAVDCTRLAEMIAAWDEEGKSDG